MEDRFKKLARDYELFEQVFTVQGLNYSALQLSVLDTAAKYRTFRNDPILDIGTGDGQTIIPFVNAGYTDLTGMDLNPEMLEITGSKLGDKVKLVQADATNMYQFNQGQFDTIISATCIHNVPRAERGKVWSELERLRPRLIVFADKIAERDEMEHKGRYESEIRALREVFEKRHGLPEVCEEWIRHYEYDEREKMTLGEIITGLPDYAIVPQNRMGMFQALAAVRVD